MQSISDYATRLENLLRDYLKCHYSDFGVKANNNLSSVDWRTPIAFALGCRYGQSGFDSNVKESIDTFLGNDFYGNSIGDVISNFEKYGFVSQEEAYNYIETTIQRLSELLLDS